MVHRKSRYVAPILLFVVAVAAPWGTLHHPPIFDELYHILAARSWAADGTLHIAEGVYGRYALFTMLVGRLFRWFGSDIAIARLPPLLAFGLLVVAVFLWTRSVAGRGAAWTTSVLLCLSPSGLFLSTFIRPYTIHALLFFLGSICLYAAVRGERSLPRSVGLAVGSLALLGSALYFQLTTLIGLCGLIVWLVLYYVPPRIQTNGRRGRLAWIAVLGSLGIVAAYAVLSFTALGQEMIRRFSSSAEWSAGHDLRYYHWIFLERYPTLWSLLPVAALVAISRRGAPAVFGSTILAVGLILHSAVATKAERYIFYLMPYFFLLWGITLREAVPVVLRISQQVVESVTGTKQGRAPGWVRLSAWVAGSGTLLFLLVSNPGVGLSVKMVRGKPAYGELGRPVRESAAAEWRIALPLLEDRIRDADVVVTTNSLKTLYEFGRYDIELSASRLSDVRGAAEFATDPRTGKIMIASAESLRQVISCYASGLFISPPGPLRSAGPDVLTVLREHTQRLELPQQAGLSAFVWRRQASETSAGGCIPPLSMPVQRGQVR